MKDSKIFKLFIGVEQKVFILLFVIFLLGFLCGNYYLFDNSKSNIAYEINNIFLLKNLILICISFLLGYTVIGFPFIIFCTAYLGILTGISVGMFTLSYSLKGFILYSLAFFPYYLVFIFGYIIVSGSSLRLSASLYNVFKEGTRYISPKMYSRPHVFNFFVSLFLILIVSIIYFLIL